MRGVGVSSRVFITGIGIISPLGLDSPSTWKGLQEGTSGIDFITAFDHEGFETRFAGEVKGFEATNYLEKKEARRMGPVRPVRRRGRQGSPHPGPAQAPGY